MPNGARGSFWVTQAAAGVENCLRIRVSGSKGTLEWMQEIPQALTFKPLHGPSQNRTPNGPGTLPLSARVTRLVAGHPEGFPDAFANLYSDAAEAIAAEAEGFEDTLVVMRPGSIDLRVSLTPTPYALDPISVSGTPSSSDAMRWRITSGAGRS